MSRIGKQPIAIPEKVKVDVKGQKVLVEGPKGKLDFDLPRRTAAKIDGKNIVVTRQGDDSEAKALHGLSRSIVNNMVKGVSEGFVKKLEIQGPKGKLNFELPRRTSLKVENGNVIVSRQGDDAQAKALHGLSRALVNNMVKGVSEGFIKKLEIQVVGFKAAVVDKKVNLNLGYSHPISYLIPDQIKVTVEENTKVTIEGPSKQVVGQVAAEIRAYYPPEPYKGKGVRYSDEHVVRKEGKTVQ